MPYNEPGRAADAGRTPSGRNSSGRSSSTSGSKSSASGGGRDNGMRDYAGANRGQPVGRDDGMRDVAGADRGQPTYERKAPNGKVTNGNESLPPGVVPLDKPKPMGATPYISDPSLGQVMGEIISAALSAVVPGAGVANSVAGSVADGTVGDFSAISRGGIIGQGIDAVTGGVPGQQTGWSPDRYRGAPSMNGIGGSGGAVNGGPGPIAANRVGTVEREGTSGGTPVSEALRVILSQAGVWPPVKASAV